MGTQLPHGKGDSSPQLFVCEPWPMSIVAKRSPISAIAEHLFFSPSVYMSLVTLVRLAGTAASFVKFLPRFAYATHVYSAVFVMAV